MKNGWQTKRLGEICEIERGGSPRPIQNFITTDPKGINWIKIGDATASGKYIYKTEEKIKPEGVKRSRMVYEGDFILSNSMSFGRPYIMKTTGCIHDGWLVLHQPKVDPDYLYHVLGSDLVFSQFDRLAAGSTVRNLNIGLAKSVEIPYPPLSEQQRIVSILDEAFEGIATPKPTPRRTSKTPAPSSKATSNPSSPSAARAG
jgi:type I restriction enzyme S subunit